VVAHRNDNEDDSQNHAPDNRASNGIQWIHSFFLPVDFCLLVARISNPGSGTFTYLKASGLL
jgi:hypothetical protein